MVDVKPNVRIAASLTTARCGLATLRENKSDDVALEHARCDNRPDQFVEQHAVDRIERRFVGAVVARRGTGDEAAADDDHTAVHRSSPVMLSRALIMPAMAASRFPISAPLRQARRAWNLLHVDSAQARTLAERAIAAATVAGDTAAEGWARLALGFHLLYYATAAEAAVELQRARRCFDTCADRAGQLLAGTGIARSLWRQGRVNDALALVLPLRNAGVQVLRHEQRGVLLNTIAGCHSARGDSAQAFAYMFEALRDAGPRSGRGFDTVLHCNLAHELLQIGDYEHALLHVDQGLARCSRLKNARLTSVLWINRVICLTELGRAAESLADIAALRAMPADASGRGRMAAHYETLAIAALRAGELTLGADLVEHALAEGPSPLP